MEGSGPAHLTMVVWAKRNVRPGESSAPSGPQALFPSRTRGRVLSRRGPLLQLPLSLMFQSWVERMSTALRFGSMYWANSPKSTPHVGEHRNAEVGIVHLL
jgi:hypothetical protein